MGPLTSIVMLCFFQLYGLLDGAILPFPASHVKVFGKEFQISVWHVLALALIALFIVLGCLYKCCHPKRILAQCL